MPVVPQPKRSLTPVAAHIRLPGPLCWVAKNIGVVIAGSTAPVHPVGLAAAKSPALAHTRQLLWQRSAALHPVPDGFTPSSPAWWPHAAATAMTPGTLQPPAHA